MAINQVFKTRLAAIVSDLEAIQLLLVKTNPAQDNMLEDIVGTPAEEMGNDVLGQLQNVVMVELPRVQAFKDFVDTL